MHCFSASDIKTSTLNQGSGFVIHQDALKFFDETKHEWVAEPGTFKAYIGSSSRDVKAKLPFKL